MDHLVHFEIHADDPARAIEFYSGLFGWSTSRMGSDDYWLVSARTDGAPGIDGAIMRRMGPRPEIGAPIVGMVNTVQVGDLAASIQRAQELGASIALERQEIPGVGSVAYVHDTEANVLGLFQPI
jgi:predicted enzyme related to lactoylglutathione lyase